VNGWISRLPTGSTRWWRAGHSRAINISIGVSDPGLGSAFGVTMRDGFDAVDARAEEFRRAAKKYLS
jgi:hypothetical protein